MDTKMNNSVLTVDIGQLRRNVRTLLDGLPKGVALIPVLKDDAYGMGLIPVGRTVAAFSEIGLMAVAQVGEGLALRGAGVAQDILVMGGTPGFQLRGAVEGDLTMALWRLELARQLGQLAQATGRPVKVQVKIETGLHRIGVAPGEEMTTLIGELKEQAGLVEVTGAFTHFADLSDPQRTQHQYEVFLQGVAQLETAGIAVPMRHVSGSGASEYYPQYHLDGVRIGRRLYMDHPTRPLGGIGEVATWYSWVTHLKQRKAGETLGYGSHFRLDRDATVATVCVGYGDGLDHKVVDAGGPVLVRGQQGRLLACCMDQCFVDVTGLGCQLDDRVTFFGYDEGGRSLSSQAVSLLAGEDEGCGLTSALGPRVGRAYQQ